MIAAYALAVGLVLTASTDKPAYMPGDTVRIRAEVTNNGSQAARDLQITAIVRFAGGSEVTRKQITRVTALAPGKSFNSQYVPIWTPPESATLGLYDVEVQAGDAFVHLPRGIVVYRQDVAIESLRTDQNMYTAGDVVRVRALIRNLSGKPLNGLKLQLGSGFPWISGFTRGARTMESPTIKVYSYPKPIDLKPGEMLQTDWFDTATAAPATPGQPDIVDMFCWITDASGLRVHDLDMTGTFTVFPPNYEGPVPYHPYYALYKFLADTDYRGGSYKPLDSYEDSLPAGAPQLESWMAFAPHFDDETAYLPLVPLSRLENVPFHIVNMTAGDGNIVSVHRYVDGISNCPDFHTIGYVRYYEAQHVYNMFGVEKDEVYYLGLPDGGTYSIFHDTTGKDVYLFTTGTDHSPYAYAYRKNLPYNREEVIKTVMDLIRKYKPADIYAPHPEERHGDHRTTASFVIEALRRLRKESGYAPRVHVWAGYGPGEDTKSEFRFEREPQFPQSERTNVKTQFAQWAYQSQFTIAERGGTRVPFEQLRSKQRTWMWYRLLGW